MGISAHVSILFSNSKAQEEMEMNEQAVRDMVARLASAMMRQDDDEVVEFFTDDAVFIAPAGRFIGRQAIYDAGSAFNRDYTNIVIRIKDVIFCGDKGAVEWSFAETRKSDGYTHVMEDAIVVHLRNGKIAYWREYFDPAQVDLV
jgi:uncharacterized protein (TIGR02246 family)